tara:strand:- start:49 stop:303 length:255 start_codon:yes stop_codon:yes gene_type:complete
MPNFQDFLLWFASMLVTAITLSILFENHINSSFNDIYLLKLLAASVFFGTGLFIFFRELHQTLFSLRYIRNVTHNDWQHPLVES